MGADTVMATYGGGGNFAASTSAAVPLTITSAVAPMDAGFTVAANPSSLTIQEGQAADTSLIFTPLFI
jgi:hypothetical protein